MPSPKATDLFHKALEAEEMEQESFLLKAVPDDPALRSEVEALLQSHRKQSGFLETKALGGISQLLSLPQKLPDYYPGDSLGDFLIFGLLGKGAFAKVYLAKQNSLNRTVALKVSADNGYEGQTLASLEHENIVKVYSEHVLPEMNLRAICMQYVEGQTLTQLQQNSSISIPQTLNFAFQLSRALSYAHEQDVLHLDIKPDNILITPKGRALLVDFNVAQLKGVSQMRGGTLKYMPPEQEQMFRSKAPLQLDQRADIYALGKVLLELLHKSKERFSELEAITARCTQHDRSARYSSAKDLSQALENCNRSYQLSKLIPVPRFATWMTRSLPLVLFILTTAPPLLTFLAAWKFWNMGTENGIAFVVRIRLFYPTIAAAAGTLLSYAYIIFGKRTFRSGILLPGILGALQGVSSFIGMGFVLYFQSKGEFLSAKMLPPVLGATVLAVALGINGVMILAQLLCCRVYYPRKVHNPRIALEDLAFAKAYGKALHIFLIVLPLLFGIGSYFSWLTPRNPSLAVVALIFSGISGVAGLLFNRIHTNMATAYASIKELSKT